MSKYTPPEIEKILSSMVILYDTREQDTVALRMRLEGFNCPYKRVKLDYGDYTAEYMNVDSTACSAAQIACVERKQGLTEICTNFTAGRERFKREFERAKADGCHVHLIVENDNYEKLYAQKYRSKFLPQSLIASLLSWSIRYGIQIHFCKPETTGRLISEIMRYELREYLINQ